MDKNKKLKKGDIVLFNGERYYVEEDRGNVVKLMYAGMAGSYCFEAFKLDIELDEDNSCQKNTSNSLTKYKPNIIAHCYFAKIRCINARIEAMKAHNKQRESEELALAYGPEEFFAAEEELENISEEILKINK